MKQSMRSAQTSTMPGMAAALLVVGSLVSAAQERAAARPFPAGEALFHRDPRWLGADAALSVPLDGEQTLWLFGDTFVATSEAHRRSESRMVRNTLALQTGLDPGSATMEFRWGRAEDGAPASFFPERAEAWYWPGHGVRVEKALVVFLFTLVATPGEGLGFDGAGYALARIEDVSAPLASWKPVILDAPPLPFDALPATAVVREGEHVVALAIRQHGVHAGALVRWPAVTLATGSLAGAEWWDGERWTPEAELGPRGPAFVLDDAGAECSLHRDASGRYVHVASYGFGASTIGLRSAPALTGPWSVPTTIYRPPESDAPRPFVYAAKAHPELSGPQGELLVTYATNSFEFADLFTPAGERGLYWPRVVAVPLELVPAIASGSRAR